MIVAGLTGSIAMGTSTVASMFSALGCPVFDADAAVRDFYQTDGVPIMEAAFPGVTVEGVVDRQRLAANVLGNAAARTKLEAIVHPAVATRRKTFLGDARAAGRRIVFLDVPLLFETGGERSVDLVVVVSAAPQVQRARALARPGMSVEKFEALLSRQTPDAEKRRRAHYVIDTDQPLEHTRAQAEGLVRAVTGLPGKGISHA